MAGIVISHSTGPLSDADARLTRIRVAAGTGIRGFDDGAEATVSYPNGIAAHPSGDFVYVANGISSTISIGSRQ